MNDKALDLLREIIEDFAALDASHNDMVQRSRRTYP